MVISHLGILLVYCGLLLFAFLLISVLRIHLTSLLSVLMFCFFTDEEDEDRDNEGRSQAKPNPSSGDLRHAINAASSVLIMINLSIFKWIMTYECMVVCAEGDFKA